MTTTTRAGAAIVCAAVAPLVLVGCGATDEDSGPDDATDSPTPGSSSRHQVSNDVTLKLRQGADGTTLSATNTGDAKKLVLLPVGEPERSKGDDGPTLTYLRPRAGNTGQSDEPELYEAAAVSAGSTRKIDASTIDTWTSEIRVCLEVVPDDDISGAAEGRVTRVAGSEPGSQPVIACST